ncbi:flagellar hook capping FlgD N-terminal domain-containing protein [uncultured Endozoicomonas sp.]|uniref:flagellar hook assembly protein FlgD n=1 Tax=uncultured Endozoicomonas sp. TaxID=432652 RepID=UPI00261F7EDA|nr:flagellar hook capping FlgD N-terminal domain-containing protein [uncultured Endozoicomonas sp.]
MTGINPVNNTSVANTSNSASGSLQVNQDQFLKLFITQLENQDPTSPQDTNQMLTQLSQISSVESLNSIDGRISGLTSSLQQSQMLGAAQLLGQSVQVSTNRLIVNDADSAVTGEAQLPVAASDVLIRVYDNAGTEVASRSLGAYSAGVVPFEFEDIKPGEYTITATVVNGGNAYAAGVSLTGKVSGVETTGQGVYLRLANMGAYPLSSVASVGD